MSGAVGAESGCFDPDLALLVERWASLPPAVRAEIMAPVEAAGGKR